MAGRIEVYLHSDGTTQNKGGAMVEVTCQTDFGAKSPEFLSFAKFVARMVYGFEAKTWKELIDLVPEAYDKKVALEKEIGEKVTLRQISRMVITPDYVLDEEAAAPGRKTVVRDENGKIIARQG
jgi:translation elongation factor EF-Ts